MPTKDRQKLITSILAEVLREPAQTTKSFPWLRNKQHETNFEHLEQLIEKIFFSLCGNSEKHKQKRGKSLEYDAYFGGKYNFIFEFDEIQHFTTPRQSTLSFYPITLPIGFDLKQYISWCQENHVQADKYRKSKTTVDFTLRREQRAFFDCFKDFLPSIHGLRPTLRISEFEVTSISTNDQNARSHVKKLLEEKFEHVMMP